MWKHISSERWIDTILLKNCDNQFKFSQFRVLLLIITTLIKSKKTQDLLVNTSSATRRRARNFIRAGKTTTDFQHLNIFNAPCFQSIIHDTCMFLAFFPEQMCSDLSWEIWSLLSLNWQVLKVLIVKFQASTLDQCHHLLINLSCKSASKPLNAVSARSAVCFL